MLCPKCGKGELKENISFSGMFLNVKKIIITYCPLCDFKNKIVLDSNIRDRQEFGLMR